MLNSECSASSQRRRSATELGSFFFEPLDFHLQPANLSVQLVLVNRFLRLVTPPAILAVLSAGYEPRWHSSATTGG